MSDFITTDLRSLKPGIGEEHKYLCENIDIIKNGLTNKRACNDALKTVAGILKRCFDMDITYTILDTRLDTDFFGIHIYPDFKTVRQIVDISCIDFPEEGLDINGTNFDKPSLAIKEIWRSNKKWHIDFDAKLFFDISVRFNPREIAALLIYEIEKVVFSFKMMHIVYRAIKHIMLNVDYRTLCISKSELCRNFYLIPFIQACGFTNYKTEIDEGSLLNNGMREDYKNAIIKITSHYSSSIIDKSDEELRQTLSYILTWVFESCNDLKYHMGFLKKTVGEQVIAEKSIYVKNLLVTILKQFAAHDSGAVTIESSYLAETPERTALIEKMAINNFTKKMEKILESAESRLLDKLGRCKRVTAEEIDVLRLEVNKIESVDDKIYYMEKVYDKLAIVNYALDLIGDKETAGKVKDSKDKLLKQKEALMNIRERIINYQVIPERFGLFIKYPKGYEG